MKYLLIELVLLLVELALLLATVILLLLSRREWHGRAKLLDALINATDVLTRQEYFNMAVESLERARRSVYAVVTGTNPTTRSESFVREVLKAMAMAKTRGVLLNYLLPKSPERLRMGYEFVRAGADVKYHDGLVVYDLRFMAIDGKHAVIGLPEKVGENKPTKRGVFISSETLVNMLMEYFNKFWHSAESYYDYLAEVVNKLLKENPDLSPQILARQLDVEVSEVEKLLKAGDQPSP